MRSRSLNVLLLALAVAGAGVAVAPELARAIDPVPYCPTPGSYITECTLKVCVEADQTWVPQPAPAGTVCGTNRWGFCRGTSRTCTMPEFGSWSAEARYRTYFPRLVLIAP